MPQGQQPISNETKHLGKISSIYVGLQEGRFGLWLTFSYDGCCGCGTFEGTWAEHDEYCKWTLKDQKDIFGKVMVYIKDLLLLAKKEKVEDLRNVPVEVTLEGNCLKSWRILTEVL